MIELTKKAAEKIKEIATEEELKPILRVKILGGGCGGMLQDLSFDENDALEFDEVFHSHNVEIRIDPLSFQYLDGSEIDYVDGLYGAGFQFNNSKFSSKCGCGKSFSV